MLLTLAASGCGAGTGTAGGPAPSVTVDELQAKQYFYNGEYLGRPVTVSSRVTGTPRPGELRLAGDEPDDPPLTVLTAEPVTIRPGTPLRVTGTVGQLHTSFPSDTVPYVQRPLYARYDTEPYLYDATLEPAATSAP